MPDKIFYRGTSRSYDRFPKLSCLSFPSKGGCSKRIIYKKPLFLYKITYCVCAWQCDQIGLFLKGLGDKWSYMSCPVFVHPFWLFWIFLILVETGVSTFWPTFGPNWVTFYCNIWSHLCFRTTAIPRPYL